MAVTKRTAGAALLADLTDVLDLVRSMARDLPDSDDPGQAELLEALALAQLCAKRLLIERTYVRR